MIGTTQSCPDGYFPDNSIVLHREYEAGFLLPQFVGAMASEMSGLSMPDMCQARSGERMFSRLRASLMQSLKLRLLILK